MENVYISAGLASVHYLALALGFWGICERTIAAKKASGDNAALHYKTVLMGDNLWGVAALLWIATGLLRAFGGFEKATDFYLKNGFFHIKMTLFLVLLIVEIPPMIKLIRARMSDRKSPSQLSLNSGDFRGIYRTGMIEIHVLIGIVVIATLMARGVWLFGDS